MDNATNPVDMFSDQELNEIEKVVSIPDNNDQKQQFKLNWQHIVHCVRHEMYGKLASILKSIVDSSPDIDGNDLTESTADRILNILRSKRNLEHDELHYLQNLIRRAMAFDPSSVTEDDAKAAANDNTPAISASHPLLTTSLLTDIFNVHRSFLWSNYHFRDYSLSQFTHNVKSRVPDVEDADFALKSFDFYPSYLINDDLFEIMNYFFATTYYIHSIQEQHRNSLSDFQLHAFVIPKSIISVYNDDRLSFDNTLNDIDTYLYNKNIHNFARNIIRLQCIEDMKDIKALIEREYHPMDVQYDKATKLMIIVDRRDIKQISKDVIYIFSCSDLNIFHELRANRCVGFEFSIQKDRTSSYFLYGIHQRIRFYPELLETFVPRIFTKHATMSAVEELLHRYHNVYKHGWCLRLTDPVFNQYYKMFTNHDFVSVNYNREVLSNEDDDSAMLLFADILFCELKHGEQSINILTDFKQYLIDNDYDSDAILFDLSAADHDDDDEQQMCFIQSYFEQRSAVKQYTKCKDIVHHFFSEFNAKRRPLHKKKMMQIKAKCSVHQTLHVKECKYIEYMIHALQSFKSFQFKVDSAQHMNQFNLPYLVESYDHMINVHGLYDEKGNEVKSYIVESVGECSFESKCSVMSKHCQRNRERIQRNEETEPLHHDHEDDADKESLKEILNATLNSIHSYLLHRKQTLFRLQSNAMNKIENNRFTTQIETHEEQIENEDYDRIQSINFGVSVLEWLKYGEKAMFRDFEDEIIHNAASTISHRLYLIFKQECFIKSVTNRGQYFTLKELLSLKIYTDTTAYQAAFRKAFWTSADSETRRAFYFWALQLYKTSLFHAVPFKVSLFHGLTQVFVVGQSLPVYHGPISTTVQLSVAHIFSEQNGLIWNICGSYLNRFKFIKGISVEWISQFKHEAEVLLVNQYLPIRSTTNFKDNVQNMVDHLLYTLESKKDIIKDKNRFYKRLGFKFNEDFVAVIRSHMMLYRGSALGATHSVLQRLVEELEIDAFRMQYKVLKSKFVIYDHKALHSLCCISMFHEDENENDVFMDCKYKLVEGLHGDNIETKQEEKEDEFEYDEEIEIKNNTNYTIYVQNEALFATKRYILLQHLKAVSLDNKFASYLYDHLQIVHDDRIELNANLFGEENEDENIEDDDEEEEGEDIDEEIEKQILSTQYALILSVTEDNELQPDEFEDVYECKDVYDFVMDLPEMEDIDNIHTIYSYKLYIKTKQHDTFMLFKTFYLKEYRFKNAIHINHGININRVCDGTGSIAICSAESITIGKKGVIDAERCGFDNSQLKYTLNENEIGEELLRFGKATKTELGGGIIELIANQDVINNGTLLSNGGSIKIQCKNRFVNDALGQILSPNHGRIYIHCSQYENADPSAIVPTAKTLASPESNITIDTEFTDIECVLSRDTEEIKLRILDHNGHKSRKEDAHPKNLLCDNGKSYLSKDLSKSGTGSDWILFSMARAYSISNVKIRNHGLKNGIKKMALYLGNEESQRNKKWHRLSIINNIEMTRSQQSFDVDAFMNVNKLWDEKLNVIKMEIVENHGHKASNRFARFAVFGRAIY